MNLTDKQWGLIEVLVSNFESTGGAEFRFVRSVTDSGLSYEGPASVPGVYDDADLRQLERERLISLLARSPMTFQCGLTQEGITMVHRRLMQQLFRNLTVKPVPGGLKPGGVRFVHFGEASAASKEAESTEGLGNGGIGPRMQHTISIPNININDYPQDFDDSERDKTKAAELRAARVIALKRSSVGSTAEKETLLLRDWILPIFDAFSKLAFNRAKEATWPIHKADSESRKFLEAIAASAGMNSPDAWMAGGGRIIRAEIQKEIEDSSEWKRHQERLLELMDAEDNAVVPTTADIEALNGSEPAPRRAEEASSQPTPQVPDPALPAATPSQRIAEGAVADLPELSESTKRKLSIKRDNLLTEAGLTGEHLDWQAKAPKFGHVKVMVDGVDFGQRLSLPVNVDKIGVDPSVSVAVGRFQHLAQEYWLLWQTSGTGWRICKTWLDILKPQVLGELASLWKGRSDAIDRWYEKVCRPAIEDAITISMDQWVKQARAVELERLESSSSKPTAVTANPILEGPLQSQPAKVANGAATLIGRNINRFRKECGWSFDELADKTGLEKKLILGHVNEGKGAHPSTMKRYADAFTMGLKRNVTVEEIES
jgi:hypothetical protein